MQEDISSLMDALLADLQAFNTELQLDQQHYVNHQYDAVEQGNINKLTLKNALDEKIALLAQHPDWPAVKAAEASQGPLWKVWNAITEQIAEGANLIDVNSKFVQKNLVIFDNLVKRIINITPEASSVYNNLAQVE